MVLSPKREEASKLGDEVDGARGCGHRAGADRGVRRGGAQGLSEVLRAHGRARQGRARGRRLRLAAGAAELDLRRRGRGVPGHCASRRVARPPPQRRPRRRRRPLRRRPRTPPPADAGGEPAPESDTDAAAAPSVTGVAAPATETAAANLPIGATVGSAGLPTLPYDLDFKGNFFQVADFVSGLDELISLRGRLGPGLGRRPADDRRRVRPRRAGARAPRPCSTHPSS